MSLEDTLAVTERMADVQMVGDVSDHLTVDPRSYGQAGTAGT